MMLTKKATQMFGLKALFLVVILAGSVQAQVEPDRSGVGKAEFRADELNIQNEYHLSNALPAMAASKAAADLAALGLSGNSGQVDQRGGRWATLILAEPLLPGRGAGNGLGWADLGRTAPGNDAELSRAASEVFREFLEANNHPLRIDTFELGSLGNVSVHQNGAVIQIYIPRVYEGLPVRGSHLTATINHGNLTLFGAENWGDINTSTTPRISASAARDAVQSFVEPYQVSGAWGKTELVLVPAARGPDPKQVSVGDGFDYRLAWITRPAFDGDMRRFEALVDAQTGRLLSFEDTNQYAEAKGGVYPKTNDGVGDDGTEQPGWPMPWMDIGTATTDTGGNYSLPGSQTATFFGPYVNMADNCGTDSLTQSDGIDWGSSGGTDCDTPGFGGAGNTHASRSGFYELNRIKEMARSHLPSNTWLQGRLTANMNINLTCNAFWNGSTVNFYRSGGGCANTGEIAAVFDHEWGHGLDDNDLDGSIASPSGEGIADIYSSLRLYDSCIGRNFQGANCGGFGDPCLNCTGVRDIDYLQRASGLPHDYTWSNANCGGSVHCVGSVYAEAVWSLWKRELQQAPYNYDNNTAAEIVTRLTYIGAGSTSTWFSGGPPYGGCAGSSGYMNYLAADDDDGNLSNGTPHMTAIYNAFNDQEIACDMPVVQDSGCSGVPTTAPNVTTSPGNQQIDLSWGVVAGATSYDVFRAEGIFGCDFGKVKIGSTAGTSFNDSGLQNGRDYSYVVIPKTSASCFGPGSSCDTIQPVGGPDFTVSCAPSSLSIGQGDTDTAICTVVSSFGYAGTVDLSCSGNPPGVSCAFAPASVTPPANGSADSTLTLTVDGGQATGTFAIDVVGDDGATSRSSGISVQVIPAGSDGPQDAVYDAGLGTPKCAVTGSSCDSTALLEGRGNLGPEPNQPNTLDVCNDGNSGTYLNDESNERIVVSTLDGGNLTEGDTVEIAATVYAWSTGSSDTLDLYFTADANNPSWTFITSIVPGAGTQTLTAEYVLPAGGMQAVRANFRYQGAASPCSTGAYDDHDDLVFTVEAPGGGCTINADCDDGAFCNGAEVCNAGVCEAGTAPVCDDGVSCTADSCNEGTDSCDNVANDGLCDDGTFCNGAETCDAVLDCQVGTPPICDDSVSCTADSCNEGTDSCDNVADNGLCDDGAFCNGAETCDAVLDCQAGTPPTCEDGVGCTDDVCNVGTDSCDNVANNANCDNGDFCDGSETCDAVLDCQAGSDPCPGQSCDEGGDVCVACFVDADCSNGLFCDGTETCNAGVCQAGTPPVCDDGVGCTVDSCNEGSDSCDYVANDTLCADDGAFCTGTEFCDPSQDCQSTGDPCTGGDTCNETTDVCEDGGANPTIWMSFRSNTAVPGVGTVADEDIVSYDEVTGLWALEFDGSDVGLGSLEISGLAVLSGGDLLLSFTAAGTVGSLSVDDSDIVRFTGTGGPNTSGTFSLYFDGSDVGLTRNSEDVDSIGLAADGRLLVSTTGGFSGTGASGADEDLFIFTGTLGSNTSGSFAQWFDGSDVGFGGNSREDVDAATLTAGGNLLFSTLGNFSVTGVSGADEDVAEFVGSFGTATSGSSSMRLDLSTLGISANEDIGSLHIVE